MQTIHAGCGSWLTPWHPHVLAAVSQHAATYGVHPSVSKRGQQRPLFGGVDTSGCHRRTSGTMVPVRCPGLAAAAATVLSLRVVDGVHATED
eukprot:m.171158 g.171158  ORF g.171158 m.171158 type:complete len:92 (-) comp18279_c0_seq1:1820-2095(-)